MSEKTRMTDEWIARVWKDNPCHIAANGEIITGPVRLAFCNVLERPKPGQDGKERSYGAVLLFPEDADLKPLYDAATDLFTEKAPQVLANPKLASKFNNPFKKQGDFLDAKTGEAYDGFVEGRTAISANSSQTKPVVVDLRNTPIVDKARVYSGCWAIVALKAGWIGRDDNKGPTFYLQSIMVVADDENLGGVGSSNPSVSFAGVKIDQTVNPAGLFGGEEDDEETAKAALFS